MIIFNQLFLHFFISYLVGSISGGILIGKIKNIDLRKSGSGNAGGTNAFRIMGIKYAILVLVIDIFKGYIAVEYVPLLLNSINGLDLELINIFCGCGVILGHVYPIYFDFKGGKGAGTVVGILLALFPISLLYCFICWIITLVLSGYVGLSTIIASLFLLIITFFYYNGGVLTPFIYFSLLIAIFTIFTHRSNIYRMIKGEENRFTKIMIFNKNRKLN